MLPDTTCFFTSPGCFQHPRCWTVFHVPYSEHQIQWEKVSNKEEVNTTRKLLCQHLSKRGAMTFQWLPLGSPWCKSGRQKTGLLSVKRIHHPAIFPGPIKMLVPLICTTLLLIMQKCSLDQKSPCVAAWFITNSCGATHQKFITRWHYPPKSFPGSEKLRTTSVTGKRQPHRIQSANSPGS